MDRISLLLRSNLSKQCFSVFFSNKARFYSSKPVEQNGDRFRSVRSGVENTKSARIYFTNERNEPCSPFHDIPLFADAEKRLVNVVVEIPRWSQAKMEINKSERFNPIAQDVKKGKLRFVDNVFPYHGYIWNYGALPQTWEDPNVNDKTTGLKGDNDPLDVCEIGSRIHTRGAVIRAKVLGALGLIDEGEADWKVMVIDIDDPLSARLNNMDDVDKHMPGLLNATRDWFRVYKIPTGKPANTLAENGRFFPPEFAHNLIQHDHSLWSRLIGRQWDATNGNKAAKISLLHTSEISGAEKDRVVSVDESQRIVNEDLNKLPTDVQVELPSNTVHFVDRSKISN